MAALPLRVLGVDPGLTRCGIGVVQGPPSAPVFVATQLIKTPTDAAVPARLAQVHAEVAAAIALHQPDVVACEQVLFSRNVRTAIGVAQAMGVALLAAEQAGLPSFVYTPTHVKAAVTGDGSADKDGVNRMVCRSLGLDTPPKPADLADALAVALCHLVQARLGAVGGRVAASPAPTSGGATTGWESVLARPHIRIAGGTGGGA